MSVNIPKPEGSTWTDDQWAAITLRGRNLLVAAAAGSGKTAVLVERIIRRICDERDPVDVDRLLVATFTNAAAQEMRERIREALEKELFNRPESEHLRRQLALINRAQITTLHSFCLDVVRRYVHLLKLDPGFRIANETEAQLLRLDVLDELFEQRYADSAEGSEFWRLADMFGGERSDDELYRLVERLYDRSRSHPWPERWLRDMAALFAEGANNVSDGNTIWQASLLQDVRLELAQAAGMLKQALELAGRPNGPEPYIDTLREELETVGRLIEASEQGWNELYDRFHNVRFNRLKACRGDRYDEALKERAKQLRDRAKEQVERLREELFARAPDQFALELAELAPVIGALVELVSDFARLYGEAKADKGLVDFSDLEHYCLDILRDPSSTPEHVVPSAAALDFRRQFVEILLDEYQDTNEVQEMIVELISRNAPGNRFMVGDVKQSIYRFRLAEPGLFLHKYRTYTSASATAGTSAGSLPADETPATDQHPTSDENPTPDETLSLDESPSPSADESGLSVPGLKIDLARNFRSRREVLDGVNFIFRQVMSERVGEIAYDESAELVPGAVYPERPADSPFDHAVVLAVLEKNLPTDDGRPAETSGAADAGSEGEGGDHGEAVEADDELKEMETAQLEARFIAAQILELTGQGGRQRPFPVYDKKSGLRPIAYRDIVILMRSTERWAPVIIEELRLAGIPAYAELDTGYFSATEIEVMLALLNLIDNPYQDIPLAAVLRSPIVGLTAEQLAQIRIAAKDRPFYEAMLACAGYAPDSGGGPEGTEGGGDAANGRRVDDRQANGRAENEATNEPLTDEQAEDEQLADGQAVDERPALRAEPLRTEHFSVEPSRTGHLNIDPALRETLSRFVRRLESWRREARQGALADLLWKLYGETGYYDFVGGLPGGPQRQANLRALYDRARQYEATSFRGLFRFLRFIERMKDSGGDLGTARALGEQEDVVRIMTIHKSKGLEFPVVFVAGLAKPFNLQDVHGRFLLHKELGFGPKVLETELRVSYPTLPALAIARRMRLEMLAEEMRVLYVALTRAREKLFLVGTIPSADRTMEVWSRQLATDGWPLKDDELAQARCYLDWIGPAIMRHPHGAPLRDRVGAAYREPACMAGEPSVWSVFVAPPQLFQRQAAAAAELSGEKRERLAALAQRRPVPGPGTEYREQIVRALSWENPFAKLNGLFAKTSVSEMKRFAELQFAHSGMLGDEPDAALWSGGADRPTLTLLRSGAEEAESLHLRRPRFLERKKMTPAERGTAYHAVMQRIPLRGEVTERTVAETIGRMVELELLTAEQAEAIDPSAVCRFFRHEVGQRLLKAERIYREVPFSIGLTAAEVYGVADSAAREETVLVQGVIDCAFVEEDGLVLVDYKTDAVYGRKLDDLANRYRTQLGLYSRALESIWKRPVVAKYLFFFDGGHVIAL